MGSEFTTEFAMKAKNLRVAAAFLCVTARRHFMHELAETK
jgi:hypothetical protein